MSLAQMLWKFRFQLEITRLVEMGSNSLHKYMIAILLQILSTIFLSRAKFSLQLKFDFNYGIFPFTLLFLRHSSK